MGAFISKQPNGLYCRFSTIVDTITHYNMTESDYIEFCIGRYGEKGRADAEDILKNHIVPLPPLDEQKRIVLQVEKLTKVCDELEKLVEKSQKEENLLMGSIMNGLVG